MSNNIKNKFQAAALFAVLSPAFLCAAIAVKCDVGSPIFFKQRRCGLNGEPFDMIKLRTMHHSNFNQTQFDSERTTKVGHFLRRYCLDEIPQLLNVWRGEMTIIGPRPLTMEMPKHLKEVYNYKPALLSPRMPTNLRRLAPHMPNYEEKLEEAIRYEITWMQEKTPLKSAKLVLDCLSTLLTTDTSGAKPAQKPLQI